MTLSIELAGPSDVPRITTLRNAVSEDLVSRYGAGHWSALVSARGVATGLGTSRVLVARTEDRIVGTARLATKKPWAIDPAYFSPAKRPMYLTDMAVDPSVQRTGIGRRLLVAAADLARAATRDAIRLDAYDAEAGAGGFYARCGYREVGRVIYRGTPLIYFEYIL